MSPVKQKLTLTVDAMIVDRAKRLGINISELTEQVLRSYTFEESDLGWDSLKTRHLTFLATMDPLLSKYGASVVIGDLIARPGGGDPSFEGEVRYGGAGRFQADFDEEWRALDYYEGNKDYSIGLRDPGHILKNLLNELQHAKERRREQIGNLLLAAKIVAAITEAETKTGESAKRRGRTGGGPSPEPKPAGRTKFKLPEPTAGKD